MFEFSLNSFCVEISQLREQLLLSTVGLLRGTLLFGMYEYS